MASITGSLGRLGHGHRVSRPPRLTPRAPAAMARIAAPSAAAASIQPLPSAAAAVQERNLAAPAAAGRRNRSQSSRGPPEQTRFAATKDKSRATGSHIRWLPPELPQS